MAKSPFQAPAESSTRPAAIDDVAAAAGVSIATVSRFLNKPDLVAKNTAVKVQRAIQQLGYRPNPFAQGLMTRRSQIVGILLPDIHGEFYSELLRGADQEAHRRGYHLLIGSEARIGSTDLGPVFGLIDGLAVMITEPNAALSKLVRESGVPVITLDADPRDAAAGNGSGGGASLAGHGNGGGLDSIVVDNAPGAAQATRHLLETVPVDRCFFVGGPRDNYDTRQRAEAFAAVLQSAGEASPDRRLYYGEYSSRWGHEWAQTMAVRLDKRSGPFGVLAGNDEIAYGVMRAVQDRGLAVPGECRIVGFDDTRLATLLRPTLSSVRVPMAALGAAAIATLIDRIESRPSNSTSASAPQAAAAPPVRLRLPTELIIRESSKA